MYDFDKVITFVNDEDVKFIRLAFCDVFGRQKNISIMPNELYRAFTDGISFDASAVEGFNAQVTSDLFLHPDPSTLSVLPWRPATGRVVRMFCDIRYPDGRQFEKDGRYILKQAVAAAKSKGISCNFGAEFEFYLFKTDETGEPTDIPFDYAGYMDIAPDDKGENVRREICLTLSEMNIKPERSHHEEGPGQNEIDFRYSDALTAADNATTFKMVVKTIAMRNGLYANFSPKPLTGKSGNGMHINISVTSEDKTDHTDSFIAGILEHIREMTVFLNPCENSYERLGGNKAPKYITWSEQNRSQLIRIPAAKGEYRRIELRSPDPMTNPYIAYSILIYAGLDGITRCLKTEAPTNINLFTADKSITDKLACLPVSLGEAIKEAKNSAFIASILPDDFVDLY
ncbi:MAG: glutamine synthetase family protein [Clostridia bacterium]